MVSDHNDYQINKMFRKKPSVKKVLLIVFWNTKGLISIDFFEEDLEGVLVV